MSAIRGTGVVELTSLVRYPASVPVDVTANQLPPCRVRGPQGAAVEPCGPRKCVADAQAGCRRRMWEFAATQTAQQRAGGIADKSSMEKVGRHGRPFHGGVDRAVPGHVDRVLGLGRAENHSQFRDGGPLRLAEGGPSDPVATEDDLVLGRDSPLRVRRRIELRVHFEGQRDGAGRQDCQDDEASPAARHGTAVTRAPTSSRTTPASSAPAAASWGRWAATQTAALRRPVAVPPPRCSP